MEEKKFVEQEAKEEVRELTEPELEKVVGGATMEDIPEMYRNLPDPPITQGAKNRTNQAMQTFESAIFGR